VYYLTRWDLWTKKDTLKNIPKIGITIELHTFSLFPLGGYFYLRKLWERLRNTTLFRKMKMILSVSFFALP
jgi:hypothetical protein